MASELSDMIRERYERSWRGRAERFTKGNETQLGAMLIAVLGRKPLRPPQFEGLAQIDRQGIVRCNFRNKNGYFMQLLPIMDVLAMTQQFQELANNLKLNDDDRKELFTELKKWIVRDHRAKSDENQF